MRISPAQMAALFEGLDWRLVRPERAAPAGGGTIAGMCRKLLFLLAGTGAS